MKSSGIKRTMAVFAISAMAVAGIPALGGVASAIPADEQVENAQGSPDEVVLFNDDNRTFSILPDGTDSTVRLEAGGGDNVGQVRFQYSISGPWANIATVSSRNDDGNFSYEWAVPAFLLTESIDVRVQDFTGGVQGLNMESGSIDVNDDDETVNLAAGTDKGYFLDCAGVERVALTGTTSEVNPAGNLSVNFHEGDDNHYFGSASTEIEGGATAAAATGTFNSVLDISSYSFTPPDPTPPQDPDHLTVVSEVQDPISGGLSQDFETYTLRAQDLGSVTAVDNGTNTAPDPSDITVTVLDQFGQPIARAAVFNNLGGFIGFTDGRGEVDVMVPQNVGINYFYADNPDTPGGCNGVFSPAQGDKRSPNLTQTSPSSIVVTSNPAGNVPVGGSVTETVTVKDGAGKALVNETVRITRTGPGSQSDVAFRTTNATGQVTYTFTCSQAGNVNVQAAIVDPNSPLDPNDTYNRRVNDTVPCGTAPPAPKASINPSIKGKSVSGGQDLITVRAKKANGAAVKIYKIVGGRQVLVKSGHLNANGVLKVRINDTNGNKITAYKAVVSPTSDTKRGVTQRRHLAKSL